MKVHLAVAYGFENETGKRKQESSLCSFDALFEYCVAGKPLLF
jgi:hypothetical protein